MQHEKNILSSNKNQPRPSSLKTVIMTIFVGPASLFGPFIYIETLLFPISSKNIRLIADFFKIDFLDVLAFFFYLPISAYLIWPFGAFLGLKFLRYRSWLDKYNIFFYFLPFFFIFLVIIGVV